MTAGRTWPWEPGVRCSRVIRYLSSRRCQCLQLRGTGGHRQFTTAIGYGTGDDGVAYLLLSVPFQQEPEETAEILGDLACILAAQVTLHTRFPEFDRLIKKFVRVLAHNGFGQPPRNHTDNELYRKSSRGAPIAGVTSQLQDRWSNSSSKMVNLYFLPASNTSCRLRPLTISPRSR